MHTTVHNTSTCCRILLHLPVPCLPFLSLPQLEAHCCFPESFKVAAQGLLMAHHHLSSGYPAGSSQQAPATSSPCSPLLFSDASARPSSSAAAAAWCQPSSPQPHISGACPPDAIMADCAPRPQSPGSCHPLSSAMSSPLSPCRRINFAASSSSPRGGCATFGTWSNIQSNSLACQAEVAVGTSAGYLYPSGSLLDGCR